MSNEIIKNAFNKGLTFEEFLEKADQQIKSTDPAGLDQEAKDLYEYTKLNFHRMQRVLKAHPVNEETAKKIKAIDTKQKWMVITENWCGDSAQSSPEFFKMSKLNDNITLRIVERDTYPEVIDLYLTNGKKSIPIVVAFDENWNQLWKWGARPEALQNEMNEWMKLELPSEELFEKVHIWYSKNKGNELFNEVNSLLK
ncbi:MAG: thioredoxin family protein [Ignavibacteriales bacterium]|nr:MAG: thioredoxin family protein [Ignavibacteriaceae bacterium]MBW7872494.1 thioredoxin family protein [Ignavibacteria bacterium]MCZ2141953.1 thioredoxin family protein [Ignavibacteriales bacterium]OQY70488.1 MAG: hypothetical protein B6D45_11090 [Ignavibacteriales bacterium UTCHB3]MBV6445119.1 hypothetical protein [Ignavibacteriaceae bacterium]